VTDDAVATRNESVQVVARVAEVMRLLGSGPSGLSLCYGAPEEMVRTSTATNPIFE
jgi:hypothetical protein